MPGNELKIRALVVFQAPPQHLTVPHVDTCASGPREKDQASETRDICARDLYAIGALGMSATGQDHVSEVSTADLDQQVNQERLSFIHSQVSSFYVQFSLQIF